MCFAGVACDTLYVDNNNNNNITVIGTSPISSSREAILQRYKSTQQIAI